MTIEIMFKKARLKLTFWYVLIIMIVSLSFSVLAFRGLEFEIGRGLRIQAFKFVPRPNYDGNHEIMILPREDNDIFEEVKRRVLMRLVLINVGILLLSGLAAYFLAGKTLSPIEEMLEDQKRFVADASHELRTPLTAMKTEIEVGLRDKKVDLTTAKNLLKSNLEEIDKMQSLSNYLLTLSRYQNHDVKTGFKKVSTKEMIETALKNVTHLARNKKIKFNTKIDASNIHGDLMSLVQLCTILIDNAVKYSRDNGIVNIYATRVNNLVRIEIEDHGVGIKASEIPYIFNRFYRADSSRSKIKVDGFGLGLSIAQSIVDLHHGKIEVESEIEKGTKISIYLSVASQ
jgi:signal transduction histidine kinase